MRYGVLCRISAACERQGVRWLAFALGAKELRMVLGGPERAISNVLRGVKVGTVRASASSGVPLRWSETARDEVPTSVALEEPIAWAHRLPLEAGLSDPLASPWTSHRDLMGYRSAPFFDLCLDIDADAVHARCGGRSLPEPAAPPGGFESLSTLLRVAGGVLGVLPNDRRCFGLFVHLARERGWRTKELASALMLTGRRIRQLAATDQPRLELALAALGDPRLARVP